MESGHTKLCWSIVEKEGFVFGVKLADFAHWVINGVILTVKLFTNHLNLLSLFDDTTRPTTCTLYQTATK